MYAYLLTNFFKSQLFFSNWNRYRYLILVLRELQWIYGQNFQLLVAEKVVVVLVQIEQAEVPLAVDEEIRNEGANFIAAMNMFDCFFIPNRNRIKIK